MIEVKPNWHDSSELLGYTSGIRNKYVVTPFMKFLVKAMRYPEVPFFVCLDEMNLAPVEQYFAEYLSVLETRKMENETIISGSLINKDVFRGHEAHIFIDLGLKTEERTDIEEFVQITAIENELKEFGLRLPQNIIVVGTVNMDDTTHQFSRKVIDRAMTIEMNELDFDSMFINEGKLNYFDDPLHPALFISDSASAIQALELIDDADAIKLKAASTRIMNELDEILKATPFRVAYRVQNELVLYFRNLKFANPEKEFEELFPTAVDAILKMKVLPRIEGDEDLVQTPLKSLAGWSEGKYTSSNTKIKEMLARLESSHYTSYWP
jgi:5-methylcytosine-specific restriction endonuclease McrBC GTP-binding regulatory subunit McrB